MSRRSGKTEWSPFQNPFRIVNEPSPQAIEKIEWLDQLAKDESELDYNMKLLDILIEDQSRHGLRIHKGFPLFFLSLEAKDGSKRIEYMLDAFIEDVLTSGDGALDAPAAVGLKQLGVDVRTLIDLIQFVRRKTQFMLYPSNLREEFKDIHQVITETKGFSTVEDRVTLVKEVIEKSLRASFDQRRPRDEDELQNVVGGLLHQIDPRFSREREGPIKAGKRYEIDFTVFGDMIAIETKLVKSGMSFVDEIIADIPAYLDFAKASIFIVYDANNSIGNRKKVIDELTKPYNGKVEVIIV